MWFHLTSTLKTVDTWVTPLVLRVLLAWEFGEAGWTKWQGENWFDQLTFPFPFSLLSATVNWNMAMGMELLGAMALMLGLLTRFFSVSLMVVTLVAIASVHWPAHWNTWADLLMGYRFEDSEGDGWGNYKLPVLYLCLLLPLLTRGAGKCSLDHVIARCWHRRQPR